MIRRSQIIERSLSCFHFGIASLIPALGILFIPMALLRFRFAVINSNDRWNPASAQLYIGAELACASLLLHALVTFLIGAQVLRHYYDA